MEQSGSPDITIEFIHDNKVEPEWEQEIDYTDNVHVIVNGPTRIKQVFRHILWPIIKPITHKGKRTDKAVKEAITDDNTNLIEAIPEGYTAKTVNGDSFSTAKEKYGVDHYSVRHFGYGGMSVAHKGCNCELTERRYAPTRNDILIAARKLKEEIETSDISHIPTEQETTLSEFG